MIRAIAGRELRSLFFSPLAWLLLGLMQFILAWLFLIQVEEFMQLQPQLATLETAPGVTDLVVMPLLDSAALILMLVTPLISMRLLSDCSPRPFPPPASCLANTWR
jgi:ABC-2 type transport system permease protein